MSLRLFEPRIKVAKDPVEAKSVAGFPNVKLVSIRTLKPSSRNARTHSKKQIQQIANSILRFGWTYPILVDENGFIIAGNGRFLASLLLGLKEGRLSWRPSLIFLARSSCLFRYWPVSTPSGLIPNC